MTSLNRLLRTKNESCYREKMRTLLNEEALHHQFYPQLPTIQQSIPPRPSRTAYSRPIPSVISQSFRTRKGSILASGLEIGWHQSTPVLSFSTKRIRREDGWGDRP